MMEKHYEISKTTREERAKYARDAMALSTLDCKPPIPEDQKIIDLYVEGKAELSEILEMALQKYRQEDI